MVNVSQGSHKNYGRKFHAFLSNSRITKLARGPVKTMSEMTHWLNVLMLDTKFPKFLYLFQSAKNNFGKNLKFHDFSMI